jgi:putative membrane protein
MSIIWRLVINAAALWITAAVVSGIAFEGGFWDLLLVAAVFGMANALIRPVAKLLTLPLNIATLGLFTFVINATMLAIAAGLTDALSIDGDFSTEFLWALLGSLVISVVSVVLSRILPDGD